MSIFHFPFSILHLLGLAAVSLLCGLLLWLQLVAAWPSIEDKIDQFRRQPPFVKLLLMLFVGIFVVFGSTKTNLVDQTSGTNIVEIVEGGTNGIEIAESRTNDVDQVGLQNGEAAAQGGDLSQRGSGVLAACQEGEIPYSNRLDSAFSLTGRFEVAHGALFVTSGEDAASPLFAASPLTVTLDDIARGWQLWEVRTNSNVCYMMPEDATLATNWWVRGAYENVKPIDFGSWRFPFGTNEYDSLWAFSWGKARFALGYAETEIVVVGAPMSAVPYRSRLWSAVDTNGARLVTWENFVLGRALKEDVDSLTSGETPLPLCSPLPLCCAQVELRTTGDFIVRSNEVETVYRRVDPEDWDGDGWKNEDDYNPYSWDDCNDDFYQEIPYDADTNAYCWIEVRPEWNTWIDFQGDDWSYLPDPNFTARAGRTYRVWLLIGKTYSVHAPMPVSVVGRSDDRIEITDVTENSFTVVWPVTFTVAEGRAPTGRPRLGATWNDGGKSFYVMPNPSWLRGAVTWTDNYCCDVWGDGTNFTYACDNTCTCEGCTVYGSYWYEGYGLPVWGIPCGCHYVPDQGPVGVSISFDHPAVIYEDAYTNLPDVVVHPVRSNAVLRCSVSGGTYGGTFSVTLNAAAQQKLRKVRGNTLPQNVRIEPGSSRSYEVEYSVLEPSGSVGDIGAEACFLEDFRNKTHTKNASMTAVKVELEAVYIAPTNHNQSRHIYGVGEEVRFRVTPSIDDVRLTVVKGDTEDMVYPDLMSVYDTFEKNFEVRGSATHVYTCPISANYVPDITVSYADITYRPTLEIVEPEVVITPLAERGANIVDPFYVGNRYCWPEGTVGAACLKTTNYIGPMHVSFQGIAVSELPCTEEDVVTGCFTNGHHRTHTGGADGAGAGVAHYIQPGNFWFVDGARMVAPEPNWQPNSTLSWKIPIGWHRKNPDYTDDCDVQNPDYEKAWDGDSRPLIIGGQTDKYKQVWHIDGQGTFRTDKFGHWISRSRDCVIILDGQTIQTEHQ